MNSRGTVGQEENVATIPAGNARQSGQRENLGVARKGDLKVKKEVLFFAT